MSFYPSLRTYMDEVATLSPAPERQAILRTAAQQLITQSIDNLVFICTHNARRSQLSQVWAAAAAQYYDLDIKVYSGGTEVQACHPEVIAHLRRVGWQVVESTGDNPKYKLYSQKDATAITLYSKLFSARDVPQQDFMAIMTCAAADSNCPFVPGARARISLPYEDPKYADDTSLAPAAYAATSQQIATEIFFFFQQIKSLRHG